MNANPRLLLACAAAAALVALTGCDATTPAEKAPAPAQEASTAQDAAAFSGTDRPWIEINLAMAEELLPLLDLAPERGTDPALQQVTAQVRAFTEQELVTLRMLHDEAELPAVNPHKGMPMPGMVTPEQVTEAAALRDAAFDALLRKCLDEHLKQGRQLATSEQTAGTEPRTKALAETILKNREEALANLGK
ncbi:DUF305 domain-containing protein [Actinoplanes sp. NPDC051861]|uniref:DUF305 domain-containing protein n=1 Tax=Actinoplanes sp. NPDC051861 TaxID=3155170 RepID=UPI003432AD42